MGRSIKNVIMKSIGFIKQYPDIVIHGLSEYNADNIVSYMKFQDWHDNNLGDNALILVYIFGGIEVYIEDKLDDTINEELNSLSKDDAVKIGVMAIVFYNYPTMEKLYFSLSAKKIKFEIDFDEEEEYGDHTFCFPTMEDPSFQVYCADNYMYIESVSDEFIAAMINKRYISDNLAESIAYMLEKNHNVSEHDDAHKKSDFIKVVKGLCNKKLPKYIKTCMTDIVDFSDMQEEMEETLNAIFDELDCMDMHDEGRKAAYKELKKVQMKLNEINEQIGGGECEIRLLH